MFDVTVGETKEFELLPEEEWLLGRLSARSVIRYDGVSYKQSSDDVLKQVFDRLQKAKKSEDEGAIAIANEEIKKYQFQFTFKPLIGKKFAGYRVQGNTGIWLSFAKPDGESAPNKLAKFYLGAGGVEAKKGESVNIDSVVGNYVAFKVANEKNKRNQKVYQRVVELRTLTDEELGQAKVVELEIKKIEDAIRAAEDKALQDAVHDGGSVTGETQLPIMERQTPQAGSGTTPF